jgi:ribosomal protein S18 acetylase RimI-like enzyme
MPDHRLADRLQGPLADRLSFRPAGEDDEPFLRQVFDSTRDPLMQLLDWDAGRESAFLAMQYLAQSSHYRRAFAGSTYDVIELDRRPVGRIFVHRGPEEIRVVDVGLLPEHRGRGIGGAVLLAVMAEAAESGRPVRLQTEPSNRALRLYERLGFVRVATAGIHVDMEWMPGPAHSDQDVAPDPSL